MKQCHLYIECFALYVSEQYDSTASLTFFRVLVDMPTPITVRSLCHLPDVSCSRLSRAYLSVS